MSAIAVATRYPPRMPELVLSDGSASYQDKAAGPRVLAYGIPTWQEGTAPTYYEQHFHSYVEQGYKKNELIYACVTANADTAASVACKVYSKRDHKEIEDHPLRRLLERPSPYLSEFDFWALVSIYEDLAGVAYFEKTRNGAGQVVSLFPLMPDWLYPIASSTEFISSYVYRVPGMPDQYFDAQDVLVFRRHDPSDLRSCVSPTGVVARTGDVDNAVTDFLKVLNEKGFQPPGVLKTTQYLTDGDVQSMLLRLRQNYGGASNWDKPLILDRDVTYTRTGMTMQEMDFTGIDARDEARICAVFQVPPIIVGAKVGLDRSTFANYQEARLSWWEDKLMPRYKHRSDAIDAQLAAEFDEDIETEFDFANVPALQQKRTEAWTRGMAALTGGAITRNMFYEEVNLPKLPPAIGDVFLMPMGVVTVPLHQAAPMALPPSTTTSPTPNGNGGSNGNGAQYGDTLAEVVDKQPAPAAPSHRGNGNSTGKAAKKGSRFEVEELDIENDDVSEQTETYDTDESGPDIEERGSKYNDVHDESGRFASGGGGGSGSSGAGTAARTRHDYTDGANVSPREFSKAQTRELDEGETDSLARYQTDSSFVNSGLRKGSIGPGDKLSDEVSRLDSAVDKGRAPRDMMVYRGIPGTSGYGQQILAAVDSGEIRPGTVLRDRGFGSTSLERGVINEFTGGKGGIEFRIAVREGSKGLYLPNDVESEFLLPRNAGMKVRRITKLPSGRTAIIVSLGIPKSSIGKSATPRRDVAGLSLKQSPFDPRDPDAARKKALADALYRVIGAYLSDTTRKLVGLSPDVLAALPSDVMNSVTFKEQLRLALLTGSKDAIENTLRQLGQQYADKFEAIAGQQADAQTGQIVTATWEGIRDGVKDVVALWRDTPGATIGDLIKAVQNATAVSDGRATLIAVTESTRAYAASNEAAIQQIGKDLGFDIPAAREMPPLHPGCRCWETIEPVMESGQLTGARRIWNTNNDALVCPLCGPLNGKEV